MKKIIPITKCYPMVRNEPMTSDFQVQHSPFWVNLGFSCKTETLGSLHSHALLILTKLSKSKDQVVNEQKFKDSLRLAQKGEWNQRSCVQTSLGVTFCHWNFLGFFVVKPLMPILAYCQCCVFVHYLCVEVYVITNCLHYLHSHLTCHPH